MQLPSTPSASIFSHLSGSTSIKSFQRSRLCYFKNNKRKFSLLGDHLVITPSVLFSSLLATWIRSMSISNIYYILSNELNMTSIIIFLETSTIIPKLPYEKTKATLSSLRHAKATRPGFEASWSSCKACTPNCHMILSPWQGRWVRWQKEGKEVPPC